MTTNRYLAALSHVYTVAIKDWGWVNDNPILKVRRPKENKAHERFLEKHEIDLLLSACAQNTNSLLYPLVFLAVATGARKGELLGLKWNDVDFLRARLTFRDTKNGETRSIHLSKQAMRCLDMEKSKRIVFSEYVFPARDGHRPVDIKWAWDSAIKLASLDICFHLNQLQVRQSIVSAWSADQSPNMKKFLKQFSKAMDTAIKDEQAAVSRERFNDTAAFEDGVKRFS